MQFYEVKWFHKGTTGTMAVKWWIDKGKVKVKLNGDIPNVMNFSEYLSEKSLKECYELIYADEIERRMNELGDDLK
jgi:hypothetical protein